MWSKKDMQPYYAITAHWLYEDKAQHLHLGSRLIVFHRFWGRHTAENMAKVTLELLDRAGTTANVSVFLDSEYSFYVTDLLYYLLVWSLHTRQSGSEHCNGARTRITI
jgi:hypothetical protein